MKIYFNIVNIIFNVQVLTIVIHFIRFPAGRVGVKQSPRCGEPPLLSLGSHWMERVTISPLIHLLNGSPHPNIPMTSTRGPCALLQISKFPWNSLNVIKCFQCLHVVNCLVIREHISFLLRAVMMKSKLFLERSNKIYDGNRAESEEMI